MSVQQHMQEPSLPPKIRMVLIVDDDPSMRTALSETVRRLGYHVRGRHRRRRCDRTGRASEAVAGGHGSEDATRPGWNS